MSNSTQSIVTGKVQPMHHDADTTALVPTKDSLYIPFGEYDYVKSVISSEKFHPIYITGLSGNGKTYMVEQVCAKVSRPMLRVNFTVETDEEDLIGGFRLINGETVFFKGPVITAMEQGAVLLLDEIDLANPARVMCLQSILEGKGYFIKKLGEMVVPKKGFTVVATANTKGRGDDTAKFIATNVMNEAFLERFPVTIEQEYPDMKTEEKIIAKKMESLGLVSDKDKGYVKQLSKTADDIRRAYASGSIDEILSTRRLVHIIMDYSITGDMVRSIGGCCNRFDDQTKKSFIDTFKKHAPVSEDEQSKRNRYLNDGSFNIDAVRGLSKY